MTWLTKIAVVIGWKKVDKMLINQWIRERNISLLKLALNKGGYRERIQAIKGMKQLKVKSIIPKLLIIARKDFEDVAVEAIAAIEYLDTEGQQKKVVLQLKQYWALRKQVPKRSKTTGRFSWMNKEARMKNLEKVRQQLKRPMR